MVDDAQLLALRTLIEANDRRYDDRFEMSQKALDIALATNNARLDGMNEFRQTLSDQADRMIPRVEAKGAIDAASDAGFAEIKLLRDKIDLSLAPKSYFGVAAGYLSAVVTIVAGIWLVIGLKIDVANAPITTRIENLNTTEINHDKTFLEIGERIRGLEAAANITGQENLVSHNDRAALNEHNREMDMQFSAAKAERSAQIAKIDGQIIELHSLSLQRVEEREASVNELRRWIDLLWQKVYPQQRFPGSKP